MEDRAEVNNSFTLIKAASCSGPQIFRKVFRFATDLRVSATNGSIIVAGRQVSCLFVTETRLQRLYISLAPSGSVKILIDTQYTG